MSLKQIQGEPPTFAYEAMKRMVQEYGKQRRLNNLGGEGGIGTRDGTREAGGNGKGKGTARTGQIRERDWRDGGETSNCTVGNEDQIR